MLAIAKIKEILKTQTVKSNHKSVQNMSPRLQYSFDLWPWVNVVLIKLNECNL